MRPTRSLGRITRLMMFSTAALNMLQGQSNPAPPGPHLQYATLNASPTTVYISRAPAVTAKGQTIYQDIELQFRSDDDGRLSLVEGFPTFALSPVFLLPSYRPGKYVGPRNIANGKAFMILTGPTPTGAGATAWASLAADDADSCAYPSSATWHVGPLQNSPVSNRLQQAGRFMYGRTRSFDSPNCPGADKVGITSTAWSYGVSGGDPKRECFTTQNQHLNWQGGSLIGVSQAGDSLTIASFTRDGVDCSGPVDQITFTRIQQ